MAITQLNRRPGSSEVFGNALGTGLSNILQGLSAGQNKAAMGQQFEAQGLPALLAQLDPQAQASYLRSLGKADSARESAATSKSNEPFKKEIRERLTPIEGVNKLAQELKDLTNHPEFQVGAIKSLVPGRLQNPITQQWVSKAKEFVLAKAQLGKGVPSKMRLALEEASKPQQWQDPQTINYLLDSVIDRGRSELMDDSIINDIIKENGGQEPDGLENLYRRRKHATKGLPAPWTYSEGSEIEDDETGKKFMQSGNTWRPLGG